jgi:signal transduction histidine kinase
MEHLAQDLIATLRESLLVLDQNLRVKIANNSFYRTFKVGPEETDGQCLFDLGDRQWDIPKLRQALRDILDSGTSLEDFEVENNFPHIGYKAMVLNARLVVGQSGEAPLILLAIDDVTVQKQAAATIQTYLHKLEWSNRELEDFAYIASHDLQEPLRAIQAFSDRLESKHANALDNQGLDYLSRIQKAAGRMRSLISDLLTYSRVTTQGKEFEVVDLTSLARECIADLSTRLEETGGKIEVSELPTLRADPVQMRQLLQNLFDNGLKFHRRDEPPRVQVRSHIRPSVDFAPVPLMQPDVECCYLSVEDNGIGFEEKYKDRIFAPFERLHNHSQYAGTGIGLAVCRRIVEWHGGSLTARSIPNQGTTFYIVLPLQGSIESRLKMKPTLHMSPRGLTRGESS